MNILKKCGGPAVCKNCAMNYAVGYHRMGKSEWAEVYRALAVKLIAEEVQRNANGRT